MERLTKEVLIDCAEFIGYIAIGGLILLAFFAVVEYAAAIYDKK